MGLRRQEHFLGARPGSIAYRVLGLAPAVILALPPGDVDVGWMERDRAGGGQAGLAS